MKVPVASIQRIVGGLLMALAASLAAVAGFWASLLRDGLGPDSIPSSGQNAIVRAVSDGWHLFLPALVVAAVGAILVRRARRVRPNQSFKPTPSARLNSRR
jgi:hypothetical protein